MTTRHRVVIVAVAAVLVDAATKFSAIRFLPDSGIDLGVLKLRLVYNSGMAFGIGSLMPAWSIIAVTLAVGLLLTAAIWRGSLPPNAPTGMVLGGAVGNVIDRVIDGRVIDMLDLGWWPTFNVADVFIVSGVVLLLFDLMRQPRLEVASG